MSLYQDEMGGEKEWYERSSREEDIKKKINITLGKFEVREQFNKSNPVIGTRENKTTQQSKVTKHKYIRLHSTLKIRVMKEPFTNI